LLRRYLKSVTRVIFYSEPTRERDKEEFFRGEYFLNKDFQ